MIISGRPCALRPSAIFAHTRAALEEPLRYEFEQLEDCPYLRRSIGRFVGDETLIARANRQVRDSNSAYDNAALVAWRELRNRFFHRDAFDLIANRARSS